MTEGAWIGLVASVPPTLVALAAFIQTLLNMRQQKRVAKRIDGRMTQLMRAAKSKSRAAGVKEGEARRKRPPKPKGG